MNAKGEARLSHLISFDSIRIDDNDARAYALDDTEHN